MHDIEPIGSSREGTRPASPDRETALEVVMPMAGRGSRFTEVGTLTPKPLIMVDGIPMFARSLASLDDLSLPIHVTFVIREDLETRFGLGGIASSVFPGSTVVTVPEVTRGAAETALAGAIGLDADAPVLVLDCDLAFSSSPFLEAIGSAAIGAEVDGLLLSFTSSDPRYSYVSIAPDGWATGTAEKRVISDHAIIGAYYLRRAHDLVRAVEALLMRPLTPERPEYYMSMVFDELIREGARVRVITGDFDSFGTPEELAAHSQRSGSDSSETGG